MELALGWLWILSAGAWVVLVYCLGRRGAAMGHKKVLDRVGPKPWTLRDAVFLAAILVILSAVIPTAVGFMSWVANWGLDESRIVIVGSAVIEAVGFLVLWFFFARLRLSFNESFGLNRIRPVAAGALGLCILLAILPLIHVVEYLSVSALRRWGLPVELQPAVDALLRQGDKGFFFLFGIFAIIVAPIFEELVFRGFAYPALKQKLGAIAAAMIVSVVFAVTHMNLAVFAPILVLGIALIVAYESTGSLLVPIFIHSGFNAVSFVQVLIAPPSL